MAEWIQRQALDFRVMTMSVDSVDCCQLKMKTSLLQMREIYNRFKKLRQLLGDCGTAKGRETDRTTTDGLKDNGRTTGE